MKEINTKSGKILIVNVLPEHFDFKISGTNYLCAKPNMYVYEQLIGGCEILGKLSELTDEDLMCMVESHTYLNAGKNKEDVIMYKDYNYNINPEFEDLFDLDTAKDSFRSLLKLNKIEGEDNELLLIKIIE